MVFELAKQNFFDKIGNHNKIVVATSKENRTTARVMSCIIINECIYFQTDKAFLKYEQIKNNPNVALCINNIQMEGVSEEIGHPLLAKNEEFAKLYQKYFKSAFERYTHLENQVLIKVQLTLITLWDYDDDKPYRDFIDMKNQKAIREYYNLF